MNAKGEILIFCDIDNIFHTKSLDSIIHSLQNNFDIAITDRSLNQSMIIKKQPFYRILIGKCVLLQPQLKALTSLKMPMI